VDSNKHRRTKRALAGGSAKQIPHCSSRPDKQKITQPRLRLVETATQLVCLPMDLVKEIDPIEEMVLAHLS